MLDAPKSSGVQYAWEFLAPMMGDWVKGPGSLGLGMLQIIKATTPPSLNWMILCPGSIYHQVSYLALILRHSPVI
jgi:hypothetical protein